MNSFKTKIIKSYLGLYIAVCMIIVFGLFFAYFSVAPKLLYAKDTRELQSKIVPMLKDGYSYQEHHLQLQTIEHVYDVQIAIYMDEYRLVRESEELLGAKFVQNKMLVKKLFPSYLLMNDGFYIKTISFSATGSALIFFPIQRYMTIFFVLIWSLLATMTAGAVLIMFLSNATNRRIFRQIESLDGTIKMINAENLALRLDEKTIDDELRALVSTINQMIDGLQNSYLRQKRFVSDVSHELRTPISVIAGYADMLQRWGKNDDEVMEEALCAIDGETKSMADLVEKLLFLARHDNKTLQYEFRRVSVTDLLKEIYQETLLVDNAHIIEQDIQDDLFCRADENRIKEVIRILLDNALKYTPEGKLVRIVGYREGRYIKIAVADEGIGIAAEEIEHIFDRFYRTDKARNHVKGDHGLGLSIAQTIINDHRGKIQVTSRLGEGSTFTIMLPANRF